MNKRISTTAGIIAIIILAVIVIGGVFACRYYRPEDLADKCKDSDDGLNYFTKGYVENPDTVSLSYNRSKKINFVDKVEDECLRKLNPGESTPVHFYSLEHPDGEKETYERTNCSGNSCYVKEAFCGSKHIETKIYQCSNGCKDGACIR